MYLVLRVQEQERFAQPDCGRRRCKQPVGLMAVCRAAVIAVSVLLHTALANDTDAVATLPAACLPVQP